MLKKTISSLELAALVNELQFLVKGKMSQIYQNGQEFIFDLHIPNKGKQLLRVIPGKFICLTTKKEAPLVPGSFCMQLRKYLENAYIKSLSQKETERIVVMELERKRNYLLILELFSKGNIILTSEDYIIIAVYQPQEWKDRSVKIGERYLFPTGAINWKTMTEEYLAEMITQSNKRNLATCLATEVGLGGIYAEELCAVSGVSKDLLPHDVSREEKKKLVRTLAEFVKLLEHPQGYIYEDEISPFPLKGKKPRQITPTYNEAINTLSLSQKISPYEKKIQTVQRTIAEQEATIKELEEKAQKYAEKGEGMYQHYQLLQQLLAIVIQWKKTKSWQEIADELKAQKKIKSVDLKSKKMIIDLEKVEND